MWQLFEDKRNEKRKKVEAENLRKIRTVNCLHVRMIAHGPCQYRQYGYERIQ